MASLAVPVDPFSVAEPSELPDWQLALSFMKSRHVEKVEARRESDEWRIKDRVCGNLFSSLTSHLFSPLPVQMKTWSVALCLCLNVGVDPPDVVKTNPCARQECWIGEKPLLPSPPTPHSHTSLPPQTHSP